MKKFVRLKWKTYSNLLDDGSEDKKTKWTKKCAIKRKLKFQNYKICLEATELEKKTNLYRKKIKLMQVVLKEIIKN